MQFLKTAVVPLVVPPTAKECNECHYRVLLEKSSDIQMKIMRARIINTTQLILWAAERGIVDALPKG
jgi:hypothetical protein